MMAGFEKKVGSAFLELYQIEDTINGTFSKTYLGYFAELKFFLASSKLVNLSLSLYFLSLSAALSYILGKHENKQTESMVEMTSRSKIQYITIKK